MKNIYYDLLEKWCDSMVALQYNDEKWPGLYGGIMCPACSMIHGRCSDAVYPFMYMAHKTGKGKYLDAAVKVLAWSDHVTCEDGSWVNDVNKDWKGITVFGTIALGEALYHHGEILDPATKEKWTKRLKSAAEFLYGYDRLYSANINYPITCAATMAVCWRVLGESKYLERAKKMAQASVTWFTGANNLIYGEGHPKDEITPRGCRPIDLGYNVEETLPALVLYGKITGDEEILSLVEKSLGDHLEFMLPDGAWDNSWGSRNFKWTYWGSRTSDGCQTAYALMADRDPRFAEAALRNTQLLEQCTHEGILYGGMHNHIHGEAPCIHHTFCHAKALATVLDAGLAPEIADQKAALPRETAQGIRGYPETSTLLAAMGPWRATVTGYDFKYNGYTPSSGGALTMLWHKDVGPVLSGSLTEYVMIEPQNMQMYKRSGHMPLTPRIGYEEGGISYLSSNDLCAKIESIQGEDEITIQVTGSLVDQQQNHPSKGKIGYRLHYIFNNTCMKIQAEVEDLPGREEIALYLPVVSENTESLRLVTDRHLQVQKGAIKMNIVSNANLHPNLPLEKRIFNYVPGFEAIPLCFKFGGNPCEPLEVEISMD